MPPARTSPATTPAGEPPEGCDEAGAMTALAGVVVGGPDPVVPAAGDVPGGEARVVPAGGRVEPWAVAVRPAVPAALGRAGPPAGGGAVLAARVDVPAGGGRGGAVVRGGVVRGGGQIVANATFAGWRVAPSR